MLLVGLGWKSLHMHHSRSCWRSQPAFDLQGCRLGSTSDIAATWPRTPIAEARCRGVFWLQWVQPPDIGWFDFYP